MTYYVCVLFPSGQRKAFRQLAEGESRDEFGGRLLCEIEEIITGKRLANVPKGVRWAEWHHEGSYAGYHTNGLGTLVESTGEGPSGRTKRIGGLYSEKTAAAAMRQGR